MGSAKYNKIRGISWHGETLQIEVEPRFNRSVYVSRRIELIHDNLFIDRGVDMSSEEINKFLTDNFKSEIRTQIRSAMYE